jgi:hypothetical protein
MDKADAALAPDLAPVRAAEGLEVGHLFEECPIDRPAVEPDDACDPAHASAGKTESTL